MAAVLDLLPPRRKQPALLTSFPLCYLCGETQLDRPRWGVHKKVLLYSLYGEDVQLWQKSSGSLTLTVWQKHPWLNLEAN